MIAHSPDPSQEASDKIWVYVKRMNEGDLLHANMPYVYKPEEAVTDYAFTTSNYPYLQPKNTGVIAKTETMEDIFKFYATYENTTATAQDPFYYVNIDGTISYGTSVTMGPLRWIVRMESKYGETPQAAYAREMVFFDGEEASGIETIDNGQLTIDSSWFTLDGRKLNGKPTKAGIYVNGGRKIVIK